MDVDGGSKRVYNRLGGDAKHQKVCFHWQAGKCNRYPCPFLHSELPASSHANGASSKRAHDNSGLSGFSGQRGRSNFNNTWGRGGGRGGGGGGRGVVVKAEKVCNYWIQGNCSYGERCKFLHSWRVGDGFSLLTQLEGHQKAVSAIAFPSGSDKLYTGSTDETARIWDCQSGKCVGVINLGGEVGCMISEGPWVFVGIPNFVKAWNTQNLVELSLNGPVGQVYALVVNNDMLFAGTQDGSILVWKFNVGNNCFEPAASLKGHSRGVVSLVVGASRLYSGSMDNTITEKATSSRDGLTGNECQNVVASTLSVPAEESMGSIHHTQLEFPNSEREVPKQISVEGDGAASVDDSTFTDADQNSTYFLESACEADPTEFDGDSVTNFFSETNLNNGITQPVHPANAVETKLNNVTAPFTTCSNIDRMKEPPKNGEGSFLDSNKCLELIDNSLQVGTELGFKSASDNKVAIVQTVDSNSNFGKEPELVSAEIELDPFSDILPDLPTRNVHKFKPKIKPRPRVGNMPASASANVMMEKSVELPTFSTTDFQSFQSSGILNQTTSLPLPTSEILTTNYLPSNFGDTSSNVPISEDSKSLAAATPSQLDSLNAMLLGDGVHNGTRDWPSAFGKSSGEATDIFCGLESLDDFLAQATTDTGKPALHSFNEKGAEENFVAPACSSINSFGECDTTQVQRCPEYHTPQDPVTFNEATILNENDTHTNNRMSETEEIVDLNPTYTRDDVFDYQSMKSGEDPTSGILVHEDLTNAADSSTLADFLHANDSREKEDANQRKKDGTDSCSLRKNKRSSIAGEEDNGGKTLRQRRKLAASKPANSSLNEDVEDDNDLDPPYHSNEHELEENDDDCEVDHSSKKKRGSKSSQKKSVPKSGKTSQKRKKADDDVQKTKEPPKKFSHSTRRKKRCVDKALLEIPEDELDPRTLPIKDIILLAEHRERQAKKEAMASNTTPSNQRSSQVQKMVETHMMMIKTMKGLNQLPFYTITRH